MAAMNDLERWLKDHIRKPMGVVWRIESNWDLLQVGEAPGWCSLSGSWSERFTFYKLREAADSLPGGQVGKLLGDKWRLGYEQVESVRRKVGDLREARLV